MADKPDRKPGDPQPFDSPGPPPDPPPPPPPPTPRDPEG